MRASSLVLALLAGVGCKRAALEADAGGPGTLADAAPFEGGSASDGPPAGGDAPSGGMDASLPTADANCGSLTSIKKVVPPDFLVVLDRSISVDRTAWNNFMSAIVSIIGKYDAQIDWGLYAFPQDGPACGAGTVSTAIDVEIAADDASHVIAHIGAAGAGASGSPTAAAIQTAAAYMSTVADENPKFLMLLTDGAPTCAGAIDALSADPAKAQTDAVAAIAAAEAAGIPTFVVAPSTTTNAADIEALNALAAASRYTAAPPGPKYFTELTLDDSYRPVDEGTSCTFFLGATTPPVPDVVSVTLNGVPIPRDRSHTLGWDYTDARTTAIMLFGTWCDMLISSRSAEVSIYFGCPNTN